jgi:3',5'-cyclic AMP phosphodiesterase CpdA
VYFKQWSIYRSYFHTGTYWFDTNNGSKKLDLFICLDTADGTLGTKQMQWLRDLLEKKSKEGYRRIIVYTHTHFWKLDDSQGHTSNFSLEETYELAALLGQYQVDYVWSGHQHARQSVFFRGVNYLVLDATKDSEKGQSYMTVQMGEHAIYHYIDYPNANH